MKPILLSFLNSEIAGDAIGIFLLRTVTGILFFFQGYDKLFKMKVADIARAFEQPLSKIHMPHSLIKPFILLSSLVEFICGLLLILGLFKIIALYLLSFNMMVVAFIFSSVKPMWDMQYYFPRLIFILILLFTSMVADPFSIDALLH